MVCTPVEVAHLRSTVTLHERLAQWEPFPNFPNVSHVMRYSYVGCQCPWMQAPALSWERLARIIKVCNTEHEHTDTCARAPFKWQLWKVADLLADTAMKRCVSHAAGRVVEQE